MEKQDAELSSFLIGAVWEVVPLKDRTELISRTLRGAIAEYNESASQRAFELLRDVFGLKGAAPPEDGSDASKVFMGAKASFCRVIMEMYPMGNLPPSRRTVSTPALMDTRKAILAYVVGEWTGKLEGLQTTIFNFLRQTLLPGMNAAALHIEEKNMVEAVIRRRLENACFDELTLRRLMGHMKNSPLGNAGPDESFFMMLAMARTRNGGSKETLLDIALRDKYSPPDA